MTALGDSSRLEFIAGARRHSALSRELASLFGRTLLSRRPPLKNGYLHLGSGTLYKDGYCNADFFPFNGLRRLLRRPAKPVDWALDIRYPLKCDDAFFRGAFCEHTLEHINVWDGIQLLGELHRVLAPGAVLRVSVPSLEKYIEYYVGAAPHPNFNLWQVKGEAFWSLTHNWGHQTVFDFELLGKLLEQAGFGDVTRCEFGEGRDEALLLDHPSRRWETLYVEAVRS
jgi:predicted SAM-dependent methyltransferase